MYCIVSYSIVFKCREIWPTEIGEIVRCLQSMKKKISYGFPAVAAASIAPKNLPGPVPDNVFRMFQISSKSVHFRWSYSRPHEHSSQFLFGFYRDF